MAAPTTTRGVTPWNKVGGMAPESALCPGWLMFVVSVVFGLEYFRHKKLYGASRFGNDLLLNRCSGHHDEREGHHLMALDEIS